MLLTTITLYVSVSKFEMSLSMAIANSLLVQLNKEHFSCTSNLHLIALHSISSITVVLPSSGVIVCFRWWKKLVWTLILVHMRSFGFILHTSLQNLIYCFMAASFAMALIFMFNFLFTAVKTLFPSFRNSFDATMTVVLGLILTT